MQPNLEIAPLDLRNLSGEPVQVSHVELQRLARLFDGAQDKKPTRIRMPPPLKVVQNRVLKPMDLRRIHYFRYGTEQPSEKPATLSYPQIAKRMYLPLSTVYNALKRFQKDGLKFVDRRRSNFKRASEGRIKIKGPVKDYLLSHEVLTEWAHLNLDQRVKQVRALGVTITPHTLSLFYRRHGVSYRVVKYKFSNARKVPLEQTQAFVVDLARRIEKDQNIVYFDETSCNMWMRKRYSWCTREDPVRMHLNKNRGHGITIMGAIGHKLPFGVFGIAKSTNQNDVGEFLKRLRGAVTPFPFTNNERIVLVVDNHPSHGTVHVRELADQLNIELLFLPPYSPELNSIESLWAIFKLDLKNRLQQHKDVELTQQDFQGLVQQCISAVRPDQQAQAARLNNRAYIHRMLTEMLDPVQLQSKEVLLQRIKDELPDALPRVPFNSPNWSPQVMSPLNMSPRHSPPGWEAWADGSARSPVSPVFSESHEDPNDQYFPSSHDSSVYTISKFLR